MTLDQCNARPTVTFLAAQRHRLLASTKLHNICVCVCVNNLHYVIALKRHGCLNITRTMMILNNCSVVEQHRKTLNQPHLGVVGGQTDGL